MMVMSQKLTDLDTVSNYYVSSEATAYPVENAHNLERRKKVWRSAGNWDVTASNNVFIFRESVGVDLTATITVGNYGTEAAFFAAVKSALEATGASTYTVSRDTTTGCIKILSNLSGGGGIFQLMWTNGSVTAADLLGFSTLANDTGAAFYIADLIRIHTTEWIKWDFGFQANPTGFMLMGSRNEPIQLSSTAVVKLQGNPTDSWTSPTVNITIPYAEYGFIYFLADGITTNPGLRYWRVEITDKDNADTYIEVGVVFLGIHPVLTRGCAVFPFQVTKIDRSTVAFSEGGQTFVTKRPKAQSFGLQWQGLNLASMESLDAVWEYYGLHSTFPMIFDEDGALGTDPESWTKLVKFSDPPSATLVSPGNWSVTWTLREEL